MAFTLRVSGDGYLEITGVPTGTPPDEEFRRAGSFRLENDRLISPVINNGQPAQLAFSHGRLTLTIDGTLTLDFLRE